MSLAVMAVQNPQMAMNFAKATLASQQANGAVGKAAAQAAGVLTDTWTNLAAQCAGSTVVEDDGDEEADFFIHDDGTEAQTLTLRMCVYSGESLPRGRSYPMICLNSGTDQEKKVSATPCRETEHPLWEFSICEEIKTSGQPSKVDIRIMGTRVIGGDTLLGSALLRLPSQAMDGPRREELTLRAASGPFGGLMCGTSGAAKIVVAYQVCRPGIYVLDLCRVAEMEQEDLEAVTHTMQIKLRSITLKQPIRNHSAKVTFKVMRLDGFSRTMQRSSTWEAVKTAEGSAADEALAAEPSSVQWMEPESSFDPFVLHESKVNLMSWFLEISVHTRPDTPAADLERRPSGSLEKSGRTRRSKRHSISVLNHPWARRHETAAHSSLVGSWREPLSDLMQSIVDGGHTLVFNADLGLRIGCVTMEVDIYTEHPHRTLGSEDSRSLLAKKRTSALDDADDGLPKRSGMPPENKWDEKLRYCCSFYADGLNATRPLRPYLRITMGGTSATSEVHMDGDVNDICWASPATLDTTRFYRRATVELFHCCDVHGTKEPQTDELLGLKIIHDVSPDKEVWLHFYGGALHPNDTEIAKNMVKGAVRPASTYQGSVFIVMGSKRISKNELLSHVKRIPKRLQVRLYKGLYMDRYKGKEVHVLVQLAGCRLPDAEEAKRLKELQKLTQQLGSSAFRNSRRSITQSGSIIGRMGSGIWTDHDLEKFKELSKSPDPLHLNPNVLMFTGQVDDTGVLHFLYSPSDGSKPQRCEWIELTTLQDFPLHCPPCGLNHVYLYVVPKGYENISPEVFARLPIPSEVSDIPYPPRWRRFRLDKSVAGNKDASEFSGGFQTNFEGFIQGSAHLLDASRHELGKVPEVGEGMAEARGDGSDLPTGYVRPWLCSAGPCCDGNPKARHFGSLGDFSRWLPKTSTCLRTAYCYIDVLAARDLPAMDEDGLMDPSYRIRILDKELIQKRLDYKTTSPTFMHRIVIPFEIEVPALAHDQHLVATAMPLPPVIISMLDYDEKQNVFDSATYEAVGTFVVKHEPSTGTGGRYIYKMLEFDEDTAEDGVAGSCVSKELRPLDLNMQHTAQWHALDAPGRAVFDSSAGGVVESWSSRPRALVAVGYSLQKAEPSSKGDTAFGEELVMEIPSDAKAYKIESKEKACYEITVDLLGLRNLPSSAISPVLQISSFWDGPPQILEMGAGNDHTFHEAVDELQVTALAKKMEPLLTLVDARKFNRRQNDAIDLRGVVSFDDLTGRRVRAPVYEVPVIPYLQKISLAAGRWVMKSTSGNKNLTREFILQYHPARGCLEGQLVRKAAGEASIEERTEIHEGHISAGKAEWRCLGYRWSGTIHKDGKRISNLTATKGAIREEYEGVWNKEARKTEPFVLLPAVTFDLRSGSTGQSAMTLTVGLNRLYPGGSSNDAPVKSWIALSLEEIAKVPPEYRTWQEGHDPRHIARSGPVKSLSTCRTTEDAYMCFVDVFAADSGFLTFDTDCRMGRPLSDQCLFYISKSASPPCDSEAKLPEEGTPQYFNPADWMCRGYEGCFDLRVAPTFYCRKDFSAQIAKMFEHVHGHLQHGHGPKTTKMETVGSVPSMFSSVGSAAELAEGETPVTVKETQAVVSHRKMAKYCLEQVTRILNDDLQADHNDNKRNITPLGPSKLYGNAMSKHALGKNAISPDKLRDISTHDLKEKLASHNWRTTSHLVAPEKEKINPGPFNENLDANLHTFMRAVGHIIDPKDRDSKLLCRLRMGLPRQALEDLKKRLTDALDSEVVHDIKQVLHDEAERWKNAGQHTVNFLIIKFKLPGTVIWVSPEANTHFSRPGSPLFAVRLAENPDIIVPVYLPSFDIRRKTETVWFPVKTLRTRFSTLLNRIQKQSEGQSKWSSQRRYIRAKAIVQQNKECPSGLDPGDPGEHDQDDFKVDEVNCTDPDGYTRPIAVSKNAFVCRIRRRAGGIAYDRVQTKNWFRTALEDVFPEMQAVALRTDKDNASAHKQFVMSRFLNLSRPMTAGLGKASERAGATILKGHITAKRVRRIQDVQQADEFDVCQAPESVEISTPPIENLWILETVFVRVYVMSAHKLDVGSLGLVGNLGIKPYLSLSLGTDVQSGKVVEQINGGGSSVNFYQKFVFQSTFPGPSTLKIDLKHQGIVGDTNLGSLQLDIEDRILVLKRREFREMSNTQWLRRSVAPVKCMRMKKEREFKEAGTGWIEPLQAPEEDPDYGQWLHPHRGFPDPSPIETESLTRLDEDAGGEGRAGMLRYIIDFTPVGSHLPEDPEVYSSTDFEVRLSIHSVDNIKIFRDFGERNDVYVKASFCSIDYDGNKQVHSEVTDVHKYARKTASFNTNMVFKCRAPATECFVELTVMDADKLGDNDLIYYPKYYSLDHHLWLAYEEQRRGRKPLAPLVDYVVFDRWPKVPDAIKCSFAWWGRIRRWREHKMFAKMKVEVSIVPVSEADQVPFQKGQWQLPRDRFSYVTALENPSATARMMLGPTRWFKITAFVGFWIAVIGILLLAMTIYFVLQVKSSAR